MRQPIFYDSHMHTVLCKHAQGDLLEYAAVGEQRGLKGIIITCHNPLPDGYDSGVRMDAAQFPQYLEMIANARSAFAGRLDVRLGMECDWVEGMESYLAEQVKWTEFDYLLGSVHPHVGAYSRAHWRNDPLAYQQLYFEHLARAAETRLFDCISHPDIVKNCSPQQWDLDRVMPDICRALDRIAAAGCAMELNTSGVNKDIPEMNPAPGILVQMRCRGIPVVIGSDAHVPNRVADGFERACAILLEAGYASVSVFLNRQRHDLEIDQVLHTLRPTPTDALV